MTILYPKVIELLSTHELLYSTSRIEFSSIADTEMHRKDAHMTMICKIIKYDLRTTWRLTRWPGSILVILCAIGAIMHQFSTVLVLPAPMIDLYALLLIALGLVLFLAAAVSVARNQTAIHIGEHTCLTYCQPVHPRQLLGGRLASGTITLFLAMCAVMLCAGISILLTTDTYVTIQGGLGRFCHIILFGTGAPNGWRGVTIDLTIMPGMIESVVYVMLYTTCLLAAQLALLQAVIVATRLLGRHRRIVSVIIFVGIYIALHKICDMWEGLLSNAAAVAGATLMTLLLFTVLCLIMSIRMLEYRINME